jgi:hypothetical protein
VARIAAMDTNVVEVPAPETPKISIVSTKPVRKTPRVRVIYPPWKASIEPHETEVKATLDVRGLDSDRIPQFTPEVDPAPPQPTPQTQVRPRSEPRRTRPVISLVHADGTRTLTHAFWFRRKDGSRTLATVTPKLYRRLVRLIR